MPQLPLMALKEQDYDAIITLKPRSFATPLILEEHGVDPHCKIVNPVPDMLNAVISKAMAGKSVAIAGESGSAKRVRDLLVAEQCSVTIDNYRDIRNICNVDMKYDFVIYDKYEFNVDRQEFSQNSRYLIDELMYTEFLLDCGYYAKC